MTHIVKVTVLGLAGITVDRSQCRYSSKDEHLPASPSKMRAVVAFSRNSMIRGTTTLSKPLTRSPNDDVVVATTETEEVEVPEPIENEVTLAEKTVVVDGEGNSLAPDQDSEPDPDGDGATGGDDEATHETKSTKGSVVRPPRRHLAVWASDEGKIGSTVTFEANLHRSGTEGTSSAFAPKSYDLTIGLTEGRNSDQVALALPLGVATLAVTGNESNSDDENVTVDLPVLTLSQARPLNTSDGAGGYPVITLTPASDTLADGVPLKKKRTGLQRLFSKKDKNGNVAFPSSAEREAFASAYTMDSADAILRVSVEVHEKDTAAEKSMSPQHQKRKVANRPGSPVARLSDTESYDADAYEADDDTELTEYTDEYTEFTGSLVSYEDETITFTAEDETITLDDSMVTNEDNNMVFFSWVNRPGPSRHTSKRRGKRSNRLLQESEGHVSINVLGRQVRLPSCRRSDSFDSREDLTHITADFFGDSYEVPLCRGIAKKGDDSTTTDSQNSAGTGSRIAEFVNTVLCQQPGERSRKGIKLASTFSTLSEKPQQIVIEAKESLTVGSISSDEAKVPTIPDEPSEVDDIMRIVRSKQPNQSAKALITQERVSSSDEEKKSATDGSPKGVDEIEGMPDTSTNQRSGVLQNIADVLQCNYPAAHHIGPRYEPFEPQIPPVVIRSEADAVSVGDLTATTHERNIEGQRDTLLIQKARQMLNETKPPARTDTDSNNCRVDGICSPMLPREVMTSSPIRLDKEFISDSITEQKEAPKPKEEKKEAVKPKVNSKVANMKSESTAGDQSTTFSPIEVVKVSSKEEGAAFSRVRDPKESKREKEEAIEALYSKSLPVYLSMNGDGSESIVGGFVETTSGDRELFNPITGQEVDQAFI